LPGDCRDTGTYEADGTPAAGQKRCMSEALVEQDPERIDNEDMAAILAVLDGIAVAAEPTRSAGADDQDAWTLCVHWLQKGPVSADTEAALPAALAGIRDHFVTRGRTPPSRLELRSPDHELLLAIPTGTVSN
jgi:hypothetical protein